jgi:hypothetical protein
MKNLLFPLFASLLISFCVVNLSASDEKSYDEVFLDKYDNRSFDQIKIAVPSNITITASDELSVSEGETHTASTGEIDNLFNSIFGESNFTDISKIERPDDLKNVSLPAGIFLEKEGFGIKIAIIKAYFAPEYIQMDMFAELSWKQTEGKSDIILRLGAWNVRSYYNEGWRNEVKFVLLDEITTIPLGSHLALSLNGCGFNPGDGSCTDGFENATYFNIDCNGIEQAKVFFRGKLTAKSEKLYNVTRNNDGTFTKPEKDKRKFEIDFNVEASLSSLYFELANIQPHYFTYDETDVILGIQGFTLDFDINKTNQALLNTNDDHITSHFGNNPQDIFWQGLYINALELYFPDKLTSGPERFMLKSSHLVIDENGIAFGLSFKEIKSLDFQKNLPVQVTNISLSVSRNELTHFKIDGAVSPAFLEKGPDLSFGFEHRAKAGETSATNAFTIRYVDGSDYTTNFIPAKLTAFSCTVTFPDNTENDSPSLEIIEFELKTNGTLAGLTLSAKDLVYNLHTNSFVSGTASIHVGRDANFKGFNISSTDVENNQPQESTASIKATFSKNNKVDLDLCIILSTSGDGENPLVIGGSGKFSFDYSPKIIDGETRFVNSLSVSEIGVLLNTETFAFEGGVRFYDPARDGGRSGFSGNVDMKIALSGNLEGGDNIEVSASIDFGTTTENAETIKYWALTASLVGVRVDIVSPALVATGAAIAVSNRMEPTQGTNGRVNFKPNKDRGLFIQATLFIDVVEKGKGNASFFALFGTDWQPRYLGMLAEFDMMVDVGAIVDVSELEEKLSIFSSGTGKTIAQTNLNNKEDLKNNLNALNKELENTVEKKNEDDTKASVETVYNNNEAHVKFNALLLIDFENAEFQVEATVNIKVGKVITGDGSVYLFAAKGVFYIHAGYKYYEFKAFSPKVEVFDKWDLLNIKIDFGNSLEASARAYFMLGKYIPSNFPTLDKLGLSEMPQLGRDKYNKLYNSSGPDFQDGVAFGLGFQATIQTPDDRFVWGKASVYAGALFKFTHYRNVQCEGFEKFGINNWYGSARAFAGIKADLSANVGFGSKSKKVELATMYLGAFLAAEFPNPSWFYGNVYGEGTALGIFKFDFQLPIEFGDKCTMINVPNEDINIKFINNISTGENLESDESIYTANPYEGIVVDFNYQIGNRVKMESFENPEQTRRYNLEVEEIGVKVDGSEYSYGVDAPIQVVKNWQNNNKKLTILPKDGEWKIDEGYPDKVGLKLYLTVYRDPIINLSKEKELVLFDETECKDAEGKNITAFDPEKLCTYVIDTVIWFKVAGAPTTLLAQNVIDSYPVIDQNYFFPDYGGQEAYLKIRYQDELFKGVDKNLIAKIYVGSETYEKTVTFSESDSKLKYDLPELSHASRYTVEIINESAAGNNNDPKVLFRYEFGTSKYNNFAEKIQDIKSVLSMFESWDNEISATCQYGEPFDGIDLYGSTHSMGKSLVEASVFFDSGNSYYDDNFKDFVDAVSEIGPHYEHLYINDLSLKLLFPQKQDYENYQTMRVNSIFPFLYNLDIYGIMKDKLCEYDNLVEDNGFCDSDLPFFSYEEIFPVRLQYLRGDESTNSGIVDFMYKPSLLSTND